MTTAAVKGNNGVANVKLLVDTGSTFTILPREHLVTLGLDLGAQEVFVRILTGSGYIIAPQIRVEWFSCCGFLLKAFPIVAHTLPTGMSQIGLLGMDFLQAAKARIDTHNSLLEIVE